MFTAARARIPAAERLGPPPGFETTRLLAAPKALQKSTAALAAEVAFGHRNEFFSSRRETSPAVERKFYVTPPSSTDHSDDTYHRGRWREAAARLWLR